MVAFKFLQDAVFGYALNILGIHPIINNFQGKIRIIEKYILCYLNPEYPCSKSILGWFVPIFITHKQFSHQPGQDPSIQDVIYDTFANSNNRSSVWVQFIFPAYTLVVNLPMLHSTKHTAWVLSPINMLSCNSISGFSVHNLWQEMFGSWRLCTSISTSHESWILSVWTWVNGDHLCTECNGLLCFGSCRLG